MISHDLEEDSFCSKDLLENVCNAEIQYKKENHRKIKPNILVQKPHTLLGRNSKLINPISPLNTLNEIYKPNNSIPVLSKLSDTLTLCKSKRKKQVTNSGTGLRLSKRLLKQKESNLLLSLNKINITNKCVEEDSFEDAQTHTHEDTQIPKTKLDLSSWSLPSNVLQKYEEMGITKMFPWQVECLSLPGVLEGKNLVYSAPTSAGKTLVAEIILLKRVLEHGKKGIFILPFVSVAREKTFSLQRVFGSSGVRVEGFMGGQAPPGGFHKTDIAVCTIEKANSIVNRLIEEKKVDDVGIVVVDELHMVGDANRGYLLELLLTKLQYISVTIKSCSAIQVVGMSATLPNLNVLAQWQNAHLYFTSFRPIPLFQMVKIGSLLYNQDFKLIKDLATSQLKIKDDTEHLVELCLETVLEGFSVLLFCPAKAWCEKIALSIALAFFSIGKGGAEGRYPADVTLALRRRLSGENLKMVIQALCQCPAGLDPVLEKSLAFGVAFHHAGLTFDERDVIEGAFRAGYTPVLVATSTLSSGVNLPARRVIIRSPNSGGQTMNALVYKQMVGRAGRMGKDSQGESILMCGLNERHKAEHLVTASLPPIRSCLQRHNSLSASMKRAVLEIVVSGAARTAVDIKRYWECTLLAASIREAAHSDEGLESQSNLVVEESLLYLLENELARCQEVNEENVFTGTKLGKAILASGLSPEEGLQVFLELQRARQCFVLESELHVLYQVTPVYVSGAWPDLDWLRFLEVWEGLPAPMRKVGQLVGVEESFIVRAMKGAVNCKILKQKNLLSIHQRFYAALALLDLVREVTLSAVVAKYSATKGLLQALQQSASTFAGMVTVFCNRLGWHNLELLIAQYQHRLQFGIQRDLCDLVKISLLNGHRARLLFDAGLETVKQVAHSDPTVIEDMLISSGPFESCKSTRSGFIIGANGRPFSLSEAAVLVLAEARSLVQKELGLDSIDWNQNASKKMSTSVPGAATATAKVKGNSFLFERNKCDVKKRSPLKEVSLTVTRKRTSLAFGNGRKSKSPKLTDEGTITGCTKHNWGSEILPSVEGMAGEEEQKVRRRKIDLDNASEKPNNNVCTSICGLNSDDVADASARDLVSETEPSPEFILKVSRGSDSRCKKSGKGSFLFQKPTGKDVRECPSVYIPDSQQSQRRSPLVISTKKSIDPERDVRFADGILGSSTMSNGGKKSTSGHEGRDRTSTTSEDLFSFISDPLNENTKEDILKSPEKQWERSLTTKDETTAAGEAEVDSELNVLKLENKRDEFKKFKPKTPKYIACSEEIDFRFDLSGTEDPKSERQTRNKNLILNESYLLQEERDLFGEEKIETDEIDANNVAEERGECTDSWAYDDTVVMTESGVLSVTRENIEKDIDEFESSVHESNTGQTSFNRSMSDSFLDRAFEKHLHRNQVNAQDRASHENVDNGNASPIYDTKCSLKSLPTPDVSLSAFNDFSSIVLTPGIDAILQGKTSSPLQNMTDEKEPSQVDFKEKSSSTKSFNKSKALCAESLAKVSSHLLEICVDRTETKLNLDVSEELPLTSSLCIIDVTSDEKLFHTFIEEWKAEDKFSLCLACQELPPHPSKGGIGWRFCSSRSRRALSPSSSAGVLVERTKLLLTGIAVSWGKTDVFYINLKTSEDDNSGKDSTRDPWFPTPATSRNVSLQRRVSAVKDVLCRDLTGTTVQMWHVKETIKLLHQSGIGIAQASFEDPRIASWLLDPSAQEKNLYNMVRTHAEDYFHLFERIGRESASGSSSDSLGICAPGKCTLGSTRVRAATECVLVFHLNRALAQRLRQAGLKQFWESVEMPNIYNMALMELNGIGFCLSVCQKQKALMQRKLDLLEADAFRLAGRRFSISSPQEVAKVLYSDLRLQFPTDKSKKKSAAPPRVSAMKKGPTSRSTNKEALEKLATEHPLPHIILEWRRIKSALTKVVYPLSESAVMCSWLAEHRIFPVCDTFTATGRITFHAPNVQNVPRDFCLQLPPEEEEEEEPPGKSSRRKGGQGSAAPSPVMRELDSLLEPLEHCSSHTVSLRHAIVAGKGRVLLAADYSQLELRLLAHLSGDAKLVTALNGGEDVFKSIASQLQSVPVSAVTTAMRQQAKQICYGIIYGMGERTLADQLGVSGEEAERFLRAFERRFPAIGLFVRESKGAARRTGYVETMSGRRRFLPGLRSKSLADIGACERQAVNTRVQGSAADLVKGAVVAVARRLRESFPDAPLVLTRRPDAGQQRLAGAFLLLQLHDELIYEVVSDDVIQVAQIVKEEMETVHRFSVRLPVSMKVGPTWGTLQTLNL